MWTVIRMNNWLFWAYLLIINQIRTSSSNNECFDMWEDCPTWADDYGHCADPVMGPFMQEQCKMSCNLCSNGDCSPTPCREGEGNCVMDSECEGSLICGQMNCANSNLDHCCAKTCNDDSDCPTSGECYAAGYILIEDSAVSCNFVRSALECQTAAYHLGLSDFTAEDDGHSGSPYDPPFCYFEEGSLMFNDMGTNTGPCSTADQCICIENQCRLNSDTVKWSRCSQGAPCNIGEGDCDSDGECEGLLICGNDMCESGPSSMDCCIGKLVMAQNTQS